MKKIGEYKEVIRGGGPGFPVCPCCNCRLGALNGKNASKGKTLLRRLFRRRKNKINSWEIDD